MTALHPLLRKQLSRLAPDVLENPHWQKLLAAIEETYQNFDSDRKVLERALDLSSVELRQANSEVCGILRALPDSLVRITGGNRIVPLSPAAAFDPQLPSGALNGPHCAAAGSTAAAFWSAVEQVRALHVDVNLEFELEVQSERRYYEIRLLTFVEDDLIGISRDITKTKSAEYALREHTRQLHYLATTDVLTDTRNRRAIFEFLAQQLTVCRRTGAPVAVIMADIDWFKNINDRFGHVMGDQILKITAERLVSGMRSSDALGRYGGEEFLAVLPGCDSVTAANRAEQLRLCFATNPIPVAAVNYTVTCSFGVSWTKDNMYDLDRLIGRADSALYCAKRSGRNRVCSRGEIEPPPTPIC